MQTLQVHVHGIATQKGAPTQVQRKKGNMRCHCQRDNGRPAPQHPRSWDTNCHTQKKRTHCDGHGDSRTHTVCQLICTTCSGQQQRPPGRQAATSKYLGTAKNDRRTTCRCFNTLSQGRGPQLTQKHMYKLIAWAHQAPGKRTAHNSLKAQPRKHTKLRQTTADS